MKIPGYDIMRPIGRGGTSTVFLAVQHSLGREVALKILQKGKDPGLTARFMEEGRIVASINHRNVIIVHDVGVTEHWYFIAMEYLKNGSLEERIKAGMTLPDVLNLMETVAGCLDYLHKRKIIHRDVKPANILFHEDGTPKLTDFGIAKMVAREQDLTMDGSALGSPYYLSPEQAASRPLDGRSDIYSLGIVFYEMLTGRKPFQGESHVETMMAHINQPVPELPEVYYPFQEMLERMVAKDPNDRFSSTSELLGYIEAVRRFGSDSQAGGVRELSGARRSASAGAVSESADKRRAGARRVGMAALALAGLFAVAILVVDRSGTNEQVEKALSGARADVVDAPVPGRVPIELQISLPAAEPATQPIAAVEPPVLQKLVPEPKNETGSEEPADAEIVDRGLADESVSDSADASALSDPEEPIQTVAEDGQIEQWLEQAQLAMEEYRLTTPRDHNAFHYYRQVLEVDPENVVAARGMSDIANIYSVLARKELAEPDLSTAALYVDRGLRVRPSHGELLALQRKLEHSQSPEPVVEAPRTGDPVSRFFRNIRNFFANSNPQGGGNQPPINQ